MFVGRGGWLPLRSGSTSVLATLAAVAIVGVFATGCNASEQGEPTSQRALSATMAPTPDSSTPSKSRALPFAGAPAVADPIDAEKFLDNPCLVLTSDQASQLNVGPGEKEQAPLSMACVWANDETGGNVNVQFLVQFREGLSAVYRSHDEGKYVKFEPIDDLVRFPAVIAEVPSEPSDMCTLYVGLSDDLAMQLAVAESHDKRGKIDPCDVAKAVAAVVLHTMRAGA